MLVMHAQDALTHAPACCVAAHALVLGSSSHPRRAADAFRKEQRKKEIARNKLERKYTREAVSNRDKPEEIRKQLLEIIELEEQGTLNKANKLKKKVLQDAYDHALKKKQVSARRWPPRTHTAAAPAQRQQQWQQQWQQQKPE